MREKMHFIRNYFANKPVFWCILLIFAMIFPIASHLIWTTSYRGYPHPYHLLWMGFYSIFALLFFKRSWGKFLRAIQVILIGANGVHLIFWCLTMLMGGVLGPLAGLLLAIFPFIFWL